MDLTLLFTIIGIFLSILIPLGGYFYKKSKEYEKNFSLVWKSVKKLTPKDFLGERPYEDLYFEREIDINLKKEIGKKNNALIVGAPLSGKTRAVFRALKNSGENFDILFPRNISMPSLEIPPDLKFRRKKLIVIDDFQNFIEKHDNNQLFFKAAKNKNIPIIATCHSGREFKKAKNKLLEQNVDIEIIFDNIYEIDKISVEEGKSIAHKLGVEWDSIKFNGTIGSIFMKLSEMERRYDQCDTIEKTVLRSMSDLYVAGVYEDNCVFKLEWIKKVASGYELEGKDFEWMGWLKNLEDKEFVMTTGRNKIWAEDAYLEYIIKPDPNVTDLVLFEDMIDTFNDDMHVLLMIGERIYDIGSISFDILIYMKLAISAFERVLTLTSYEKNEAVFFKANNYLGMSYWNISKVEGILKNCEKSIGYFENILKYVDINNRPLEYASTKNRIANTLVILAESKDKIENCRYAIKAYGEALKMYTIKNFPVEYAQVNNNLGGAYNVLSDVENGPENLIKAKACFEEALRIRTLKNDPIGFAFTKNNLGNVFARLSQLEDPEKHFELALESYTDALKIYKKDKFPLQYGLAMNNIGNVYCIFSDIKNKKENALKALDAYEKALEVRTSKNAPIQYSRTMFNIGDVYMILNEAENKTVYLHKAIESITSSLDLDLSNIAPYRQGEIHNLLGRAFMLLAEKVNSQENYEKGMEAFEKALEVWKHLKKALKIFTEKEYPEMYNRVQYEKELAAKKFMP